MNLHLVFPEYGIDFMNACFIYVETFRHILNCLIFVMILFLRGGNNGIIFTWISNEKTKCLISQISCHQTRHLLKLADALPLSTNSFLIMTIKWRGQGNGCWHFPCSMKKIYIKSKKLQFVWSVTEQYMNELSDWVCISKPYTVFMQYTK